MRPSIILLGALLCLSCNSKPSGSTATTGEATSSTASAASTTTARSSASASSDQAPGGVGAQASASAALAGSGSPPAASASASALGLSAPGNHPELVSMARRIVETCKWARGNWTERCKALDEWQSWFEFAGHDSAEKTLIAFCGDGDPKVRKLCSSGLQYGVSSIHDPKMAAAILDAFEKERDEYTCEGMVRAITAIRIDKAGQEERVKQVARSHPDLKCRSGLINGLSDEHFYDFLVDLAKTDKNPEVRGAAAMGLRASHQPERAKNNCKVWLEMLDERDQPFTGKVAWALAVEETCAGQWDTLLQGFEALVTAGKVRPPIGNLACEIHNQKRAKPEQKTQVLDASKKLVDNDRSPISERISALQCVARHDPDGKAFAARFVDSPVEPLKSAAVKLTGSPAASGSARPAVSAPASGSARGAGSAPP